MCLHAGNSFENVQRLVERIKEWLVKMDGLEGLEKEEPRRERVEFVKAAL